MIANDLITYIIMINLWFLPQHKKQDKKSSSVLQNPDGGS